jgi:NAD(P)-dependent dehydrogenase (short-subunit alcohol dehydrogenase family)
MMHIFSGTPYDCSNKIALVTGAAGLMGVQHAAALLETGARVIITDVDRVKLDQVKAALSITYPEDCIIVEILDVTNSDNIEVINGKYHIDILVNNAAVDPKVDSDMDKLRSSRFENFSEKSWKLELDVGITGAFLCTKIVGHSMALRQNGVILNIASDLSVIAPDQRIYRQEGLSEELQPVKPVTYSVIKSALVGLTKYTASYWAKESVRCNALSPGGIFNKQSQDFVDKLTSLIPMNRMAEVTEYKSAIQFLTSDASAYMTGQNIVMDGGRSII